MHNLDGLAVQREWEAQGKQGDFRSFWDQHHQAIASEMTPEEKAQTEKIYGAKIKSDVHMAAEFVQLLLRGEFRGLDAKPNNALTRMLTWIKNFWGGFTGNDTNAEVSTAARNHVSKIEAILNSRNLPRPSGKGEAVAVGASVPPDAAGVEGPRVEQPASPGAGAPGTGGVEGSPANADGVSGSLGAGLPGEWTVAAYQQVQKVVENLQGVTDTEKDLITTHALDEVFKRAAEYHAANDGNMEGFATAKLAQQQAINGLKAERAKKRSPEGGSVSLDAPLAPGSDQTVSETVPSESDAVTAATDVTAAAKRLMAQLPDASRKLLEMVESGERGWMAKLAKEEGVTKAAISSRLETARKQLARLMMTDPAARESMQDLGYDPDDLINAAPILARNEDVNEKDARDAIRALITRGAFEGSPQRLAIAEKLISMDKGGITVRVVDQDTASQFFRDPKVAGFWSDGARMEKGIYLVEGRWNVRPGQAIRSIVHEYIHGLTHEFIKANPDSDLVVRLIDLGREAYLKRLQKGDTTYDGYAFNFVHENQANFASEFLAEAMASARLQKFLGSLRAPKWAAEGRIETVWDAFVDTVRSILGLKKGTALADVLSTGFSIVESAGKAEDRTANSSKFFDFSSGPFIKFTAEEVLNAAPPIQTADMMGPARKARDLSPSQKLTRFFRPSTWGIPGYLRDVAKNTESYDAAALLENLADAVDDFYDYKASLIGAAQSHFFKTTAGLDAATLQKVKDEVELWASTAQARDNGQNMQTAWMNAERVLSTLSKEAQQIIDDIKRHGQASGILMTERLDVHVQAADGGWRPLINLGEMWWPRRINDRVNEILGDPDHHKQSGEYWKLVNELMAHDPIKFDTAEKTDAYLSNRITGTMGNGDFFAGAEMARGEKLPDSWYDYTLDGYLLNMESWANRVAQIAAFGQSRPAAWTCSTR